MWGGFIICSHLITPPAHVGSVEQANSSNDAQLAHASSVSHASSASVSFSEALTWMSLVYTCLCTISQSILLLLCGPSRNSMPVPRVRSASLFACHAPRECISTIICRIVSLNVKLFSLHSLLEPSVTCRNVSNSVKSSSGGYSSRSGAISGQLDVDCKVASLPTLYYRPSPAAPPCTKASSSDSPELRLCAIFLRVKLPHLLSICSTPSLQRNRSRFRSTLPT